MLDGGSGVDQLEGGTGDEVLVLADVRDAVTELPLGIDGGGNDTIVVADSFAQSLKEALPATQGKAAFVLGRTDVAHFPTDVASYRQQIDPDIEDNGSKGTPTTTWWPMTAPTLWSATTATTTSMAAAAAIICSAPLVLTGCTAAPATIGSRVGPGTTGSTADWATTRSMAVAVTTCSCWACTRMATGSSTIRGATR